MFTPNDFLKILKFFYDLKVLQDQGSTDIPESELDPYLVVTLLADQTKSKTLFENTIDQICFSTDDYKRLKNFVVDWYSSFRGMSSTQKSASQVYSMPEEHVNELILSFGFEARSLLRIPKQNKVNLFFDLVNLYKIKGTPEALGRILQYYNLPDIEILEYWLRFNEEEEIILRPSLVWSSMINTYPIGDASFDELHILDPHWFLTEEQIREKLATQYCSFPSKTPYIGIRPILRQSGKNQYMVSTVLSRFVHDEYDTWLATGTITENEVDLIYFNINVSILEAYLSYVYIFNKYHNRLAGGLGPNYLCYDGTSMPNISIIEAEMENLIVRPKTRAERKEKYDSFVDLFTRDLSGNFLSTANSAGEKLSFINPTLKALLDTEYAVGNSEELLLSLAIDISYWISWKLGGTYPNLADLIYGLASLSYIKDKIDFFKPYRARLIYVSSLYAIENPLEDSIVQEDNFFTQHIETIVDWDTADSRPGYLEDFDPIGSYVTSTPLNPTDKQILDMYIDSTGAVKATYTDTPTSPTVRVTSTPSAGDHRIISIYLDIIDGQSIMNINYSSEPETIGGLSTYVMSDPVPYTHYILDIYYNASTELTIIYDSEPIIWPIDSTARIYYSRNLYDCGSFFDIGASCDNPPTEEEPFIYLVETIPEIYNYHSDYEDSSSSIFIEWDTDPDSGEIVEIRTDGGWDEMDTGLLFDNPVINDVCTISIIELRYWVTGGDGLFSSTNNWSTISGGPSGASFPNTEYYRAIFDANSNIGENITEVTIDAEVLCDIDMSNNYISFQIVDDGKFKLKNDLTICSLGVKEYGIFTTNGYTFTATTLLVFEDYSIVDINDSIVKVGLNLLSGYANSGYYTAEFSELTNSGCNLEIYAPSVIYSYNSSVYDKVTFILDDNTITCYGSMFKNTFEVIGSGTIIGA